MSKGLLKPEDEEIIRKNYTFLKNEIDANKLVDFLFEKGVIDLEEKLSINQEQSKTERNEKLLAIMLDSGPGEAFNYFKKSLEKSYIHVLKHLEAKELEGNVETDAIRSETDEHVNIRDNKFDKRPDNGQSEEVLRLRDMKINESLIGADQTLKTKNFDNYKHVMDYELKKDNFEILIINHEDDDNSARNLKALLMKNVRYVKGNEEISPEVELFDDMTYEDHSPTIELDFPLKKALNIFFLATKSSCHDNWTLFKGRVSLDSVFKMFSQKNFFFVIHTMPEVTRDYTLPLTLNTVKFFYFGDTDDTNKSLFQRVQKLLKSKENIQIKKDDELFKRRQQFLEENHPDLYEEFCKSNDTRFQRQAEASNSGETKSRAEIDDDISGIIASSTGKFRAQQNSVSSTEESIDEERVKSGTTHDPEVVSVVEVDAVVVPSKTTA